ncbi:hypothetical protein [Enterococcus faecium]|uniref:Uncharacterized protein n=1 Tax=Enterococcus faecium TaxID=1352 RepID=A0A7T8KSJ4_ENTFC|nr:hypothetical protein [Enterococcus faecium]QQP61281.1 hypothetical protein [Enterococcus faecium]HAQ2698699.1 hypothetical protein [Enterococcus faecium]HAR1718465.1 hypothetical protein [Enterococcus faecium]HBK5672134.1 hypothetical protein [Enterococcus faecium]HBK5672448.1 hypothetical protein [Enterococcus faecium]
MLKVILLAYNVGISSEAKGTLKNSSRKVSYRLSTMYECNEKNSEKDN